MQEQSQARYADCIAYKGAETATGHGACITLASGACKTYNENHLFKVCYEILFTPVTYAVVNKLKKVEEIDTFDEKVSYNPFGKKGD